MLMSNMSENWNMEALHSMYFLHLAVWGRQLATTTYQHLAHLLSEKWTSSYSVVMGWLHCCLFIKTLQHKC